MRDLEDDPELRANINLYKDDDIMAELESKMQSMGLDEVEPSQLSKDLNKGTAKVAGQEREIKSAVRKTAIGKAKAYQMEKERQKSEALYKASLNMREEVDDDSDWESVEEDAPAIKLEELLGNLQIKDDEEENPEEEKVQSVDEDKE